MSVMESAIRTLNKRSDILLAAALVSIIFMMIIPIPTLVIDIMIALNMAVAVTLLMVGVYIPSPLAFSVFPTVLLITTLFRLSLSVSTTRLILLDADAGEIIYAFGDFVVQSNMIVGLVIFLIITVVSFVVVTKGSERVAEVSARFSLDGMPGKQMSIDSDMRSGVITLAQARQRRSELESENQLYGAMDGAMKFVKGDAIAGLIIIFVNIVGGLSVGVLQQGMSASEALEIYSILTIGDGLVAQIPALFIAVTAGIIVTRVTSSNDVNLGADISTQILAQPRALLVGSVLLFFMAWIPGFPVTIFLCLSALIGMVGLFLHKAQKQGVSGLQDSPLSSMDSEPSTLNNDSTNYFTPNAPVILQIAHNLRESISPTLLNTELAQVRQILYQSLGIPFPGVHLRFSDHHKDGQYSILLYDVPITEGYIKSDAIFTASDEDTLKLFNIPYDTGQNFLPGIQTHWVENNYLPILQDKQIEILSIPQILSHHLAHVLRRHAYQFIGIQETHFLLNQAEARYSELIKESFRNMSISKISDILRELVREDVPITNLRTILESLVSGSALYEETDKLVEHVRSSLRDQITHKYSDSNILPVYLLDNDTEEHMRNSIRQTPQGISLSMSSDDTSNILTIIKQLINHSDGHQDKAALLVPVDLRRQIRKLIEIDFYELPVLSYSELAPHITVQPIGKIGLPRLEGS